MIYMQNRLYIVHNKGKVEMALHTARFGWCVRLCMYLCVWVYIIQSIDMTMAMAMATATATALPFR